MTTHSIVRYGHVKRKTHDRMTQSLTLESTAGKNVGKKVNMVACLDGLLCNKNKIMGSTDSDILHFILTNASALYLYKL